jgi:hypothetical protein
MVACGLLRYLVAFGSTKTKNDEIFLFSDNSATTTKLLQKFDDSNIRESQFAHTWRHVKARSIEKTTDW